MRAIGYVQPGRLRLESRNLREITDGYPEVRGLLRDLGMHEAVFDGEIVAFDEDHILRASRRTGCGARVLRARIGLRYAAAAALWRILRGGAGVGITTMRSYVDTLGGPGIGRAAAR